MAAGNQVGNMDALARRSGLAVGEEVTAERVGGLMTGAMIFSAIVGFFLSDIFAGLPTVTNGVSYWATKLPCLVHPLWLAPTLLLRRGLFTRGTASAGG